MNTINFRQIFQTFQLMTSREKVQVSGILCFSVLNGLIQTLGIVSIMPFIAIVSEPQLVETNQYIIHIKNWLGVTDYKSLLVFFAAFTFLALLLSNVIMVINYWMSLHFFNQRGQRLSTQLLNIYLGKSISIFNSLRVADLSKNIYSEVDRVLIGTQIAAIEMITDVFICIVMLSLLLYIDVWVTLSTALTLGAAYYLTYKILSRKINELGKSFSAHESDIFSSLYQALALFREIRISGKQGYFVEKFKKPVSLLADNATKFYTLSFIPVQLIELIAFALILFASSYVAIQDDPNKNVIVTISIFAFAAYRFIPILKSIFDSTEEILYGSNVLTLLMKQFAEAGDDPSLPEHRGKLVEDDANHGTQLTENIIVDQLTYSYNSKSPAILDNLSIEIPKHAMTCIKGRSGLGKSTLLDLLLGLLEPQKGEIRVNGVPLSKQNIADWQSKLGYVPQKIQFLNGTVAENIAFGVAADTIDYARVQDVAKLARIDQLIENRMPDRYKTLLGDGGVPTSGGERQRIGIARALYHNPEVLLFDEATNELDQDTENELMQNLRARLNTTLIFVSHKPNIMAMADKVIDFNLVVEKGIKASA